MALFLTLQAQGAEWVYFTPCGFRLPPDPQEDALIEEGSIGSTQVAPRYVGFAVDPDAVVGLVGYKASKISGGPPCTLVVLSGGQRRLVIGTLEQVIKKLEK